MKTGIICIKHYEMITENLFTATCLNTLVFKLVRDRLELPVFEAEELVVMSKCSPMILPVS